MYQCISIGVQSEKYGGSLEGLEISGGTLAIFQIEKYGSCRQHLVDISRINWIWDCLFCRLRINFCAYCLYLIQKGAKLFKMLSTNCNNDREFCRLG
jgi:hypothetical protein